MMTRLVIAVLLLAVSACAAADHPRKAKRVGISGPISIDIAHAETETTDGFLITVRVATAVPVTDFSLVLHRDDRQPLLDAAGQPLEAAPRIERAQLEPGETLELQAHIVATEQAPARLIAMASATGKDDHRLRSVEGLRLPPRDEEQAGTQGRPDPSKIKEHKATLHIHQPGEGD